MTTRGSSQEKPRLGLVNVRRYRSGARTNQSVLRGNWPARINQCACALTIDQQALVSWEIARGAELPPLLRAIIPLDFMAPLYHDRTLMSGIHAVRGAQQRTGHASEQELRFSIVRIPLLLARGGI